MTAIAVAEALVEHLRWLKQGYGDAMRLCSPVEGGKLIHSGPAERRSNKRAWSQSLPCYARYRIAANVHRGELRCNDASHQ